MARPTKQGIDYYPLDVQFDDKVELFIAETGAEGLGILITIWQLIYQNEGYYVQHNDDLILLIRRRIMADIDKISIVISCAISRGIFSESLHKKHKILTSSAIQKRYFIGAKKKKIVSVVKNYLTIDVSDVGNLVYCDGNAIKEEEDVKEKVEEDSEEIDSGDKPPSRFSEFWEIYNYKKGRKKAEDAWKRKKLDNIADEVIDGARRYVQARGSEAKYWKHAQGWLNDERWGDDYIPERGNGKPRRRSIDEMNYGDVVEDL